MDKFYFREKRLRDGSDTDMEYLTVTNDTDSGLYRICNSGDMFADDDPSTYVDVPEDLLLRFSKQFINARSEGQ